MFWAKYNESDQTPRKRKRDSVALEQRYVSYPWNPWYGQQVCDMIICRSQYLHAFQVDTFYFQCISCKLKKFEELLSQSNRIICIATGHMQSSLRLTTRKHQDLFNLYQAAAPIGHLSPWTLDIAGFKLGDLRLWGWQGIKWRSKCFWGWKIWNRCTEMHMNRRRQTCTWHSKHKQKTHKQNLFVLTYHILEPHWWWQAHQSPEASTALPVSLVIPAHQIMG